MNLIPQFYDVAAGSILVDGVDIRFGRENATDEEAAHAAGTG